MPTPARRATASRLASGPPALNTAFAASSTRSRLRIESARGFRTIVAAAAIISLLLDHILITFGRLTIPSRCSSITFSKNPLPFLRSYGGLESGGYLRICRSASSLARPPIPLRQQRLDLTIALIGAPHEPVHQPHRERRAAGRRVIGSARHAARSPA